MGQQAPIYVLIRLLVLLLSVKSPAVIGFAGTFITEWTDGAKMCEDFLKDEESYRRVADKLVQISHCYGFDGWLVNIENALSVSQTSTQASTTTTPTAYSCLLDESPSLLFSFCCIVFVFTFCRFICIVLV